MAEQQSAVLVPGRVLVVQLDGVELAYWNARSPGESSSAAVCYLRPIVVEPHARSTSHLAGHAALPFPDGSSTATSRSRP